MRSVPARAFAQNSDVVRDCPPIGQTGKGELVHSLDCKAIKAENADLNYKPKMPSSDTDARGNSDHWREQVRGSGLCDVGLERRLTLRRRPQFANEPANISRLHRI
jgi:hypothetical protein